MHGRRRWRPRSRRMLEPPTRRPYTHERPRTEGSVGVMRATGDATPREGCCSRAYFERRGDEKGGGGRRGGFARGGRDNVWSWKGTRSAHACAATARWLRPCGSATRPCVVSTSVWRQVTDAQCGVFHTYVAGVWRLGRGGGTRSDNATIIVHVVHVVHT